MTQALLRTSPFGYEIINDHKGYVTSIMYQQRGWPPAAQVLQTNDLDDELEQLVLANTQRLLGMMLENKGAFDLAMEFAGAKVVLLCDMDQMSWDFSDSIGEFCTEAPFMAFSVDARAGYIKIDEGNYVKLV